MFEVHVHNNYMGSCFGVCFWLQSLISKASAEVNELRKSIDLLKAEGEKLEVKKMFHISSY